MTIYQDMALYRVPADLEQVIRILMGSLQSENA